MNIYYALAVAISRKLMACILGNYNHFCENVSIVTFEAIIISFATNISNGMEV
jgi:hypothetical protein